MAYRAEQIRVDGVDVVRLHDDGRHSSVSIVPSIGNIAYAFNVGDHQVLWTPYNSPAELKQKPVMGGIPFLAPWANRLSGDRYWVNGREYKIDSQIDNIRRDAFGHPIHGLVLFAPWTIVDLAATGSEARVTSRLDLSGRPDWLEQFPFPHSLTLTHSLSRGQLTVLLQVANHSHQALPLSMGFHPYFAVPGGDRDRCRVSLPVGNRLRLNSEMLPTGETEPWDADKSFDLAGHSFDDGFTSLVRSVEGDAIFRADGGGLSLEVGFGPLFSAAVLYAPPGKPFLCFEPMTAITNAFNLAHEGKYDGLQEVAPGDTWEERFWIRVVNQSQPGQTSL
jgi:aldose 1-epimerase